MIDQWEDESDEEIDKADIELFDDDNEYPDPSDDEFDEYEDERESLRGTSQCDGLCDPQCNWCLVAHHCPDECAGGACPYDALDEGPMRALPVDESFDIGF